jgi:hypothetical protein
MEPCDFHFLPAFNDDMVPDLDYQGKYRVQSFTVGDVTCSKFSLIAGLFGIYESLTHSSTKDDVRVFL